MIKTILARIHQKHRTMKYPKEPAVLPGLFRGYPELHPEKCPPDCTLCADACPYGALKAGTGDWGPGTGCDSPPESVGEGWPSAR